MRRMMKYIPLMIVAVLQVGFCSFAGAMELMGDRELVFADGPVGVYRIPLNSPAGQSLLPASYILTAEPTKPASVTLNTLPTRLIDGVYYVVYDAPLNESLDHDIIVLITKAGDYKVKWKISSDPSKPAYKYTQIFTITDVPYIYDFYLSKTPTTEGMYGFTGTVVKVGKIVNPAIHTDSCKYVVPVLPAP